MLEEQAPHDVLHVSDWECHPAGQSTPHCENDPDVATQYTLLGVVELQLPQEVLQTNASGWKPDGQGIPHW